MRELQSTKSNPALDGLGCSPVLVSGTKATFSSGWQGFKKRLDSHSERELLDHLEIADELPGTVAPEAAMSVREAT